MSYTVINYSDIIANLHAVSGDVIANTPSSYMDNLISNQSGGELQRGNTQLPSPSYSFSSFPTFRVNYTLLSYWLNWLLSHYTTSYHPSYSYFIHHYPSLPQTLPTFPTIYYQPSLYHPSYPYILKIIFPSLYISLHRGLLPLYSYKGTHTLSRFRHFSSWLLHGRLD